MKIQKIILFTLIFCANQVNAALVCSKAAEYSSVQEHVDLLRNWPAPAAQATYISAPGILESERYAANYCPEYVASTGEIVRRPGSMKMLEKPTSCNFPEVALRKKDNTSTKELSLISQILSYIQNRTRSQKDTILDVKIQDHRARTGQPEAGLTVKAVDLDITKVNFGQEADMATLEKTYAQHIHQWQKGPIVLHGFSRGAATTLNFLSTTYKNQPAQNRRVRACILEACYEKIPAAPLPVPEWVFRCIFTGYKAQGLWPQHTIKDFPQDIPVLFVTSKKDSRVSPEHSRNLYRALRTAGHQKAHVLELESATHPGYTYDNRADKEKYETTVHAFYKKYGLPHDPDLAARGEQFFESTQPSTSS
jgi:hypothetical protein